MTRGERWKKFFAHKGWLNNDVVNGGKEGSLKITICPGAVTGDCKTATIDMALVFDEFDVLCYESPSGTIFFQWDDILQVRLEPRKDKKGWL